MIVNHRIKPIIFFFFVIVHKILSYSEVNMEMEIELEEISARVQGKSFVIINTL